MKLKMIKESPDVAEYQKWVDYDMKKYGHISDITKNKLAKAGLETVVDDYGDYEVIAKERDGKSIKEAGANPSTKKPSEVTKDEWESGNWTLTPNEDDTPTAWDAEYALKGDTIEVNGNLGPGGIGIGAVALKLKLRDADRFYTAVYSEA